MATTLMKRNQSPRDEEDLLDLPKAPTNLQNIGKQRYTIVDEGELESFREVRLDDFPGYAEVKDKIAIIQQLKNVFVQFYALNSIATDQVQNPPGSGNRKDFVARHNGTFEHTIGTRVGTTRQGLPIGAH